MAYKAHKIMPPQTPLTLFPISLSLWLTLLLPLGLLPPTPLLERELHKVWFLCLAYTCITKAWNSAWHRVGIQYAIDELIIHDCLI